VTWELLLLDGSMVEAAGCAAVVDSLNLTGRLVGLAWVVVDFAYCLFSLDRECLVR